MILQAYNRPQVLKSAGRYWIQEDENPAPPRVAQES